MSGRWILGAAVLVALPALAAEPGVRPVRVGDLVVRVEREGRVDAARRCKVRADVQAFGGPLEVVEVARRSGAVAAGELLVKFAPDKLELAIRDAREAAEQARVRLALAQAEKAAQAEASRLRLERAERQRVRAEKELFLFKTHGGPKMLRAAELDVAGREHGLQGQKEELEQLEKMYQGTRLASETKDIVLERTRRGVALSEAWLEIARMDLGVTTEHTFPTRLRDLEDEWRWATQAVVQAREEARIAEERKALEAAAATSALRDAEDRVAKLEADRDRLVVRAPAAGFLTPIELQPGDHVQPRQVVAEVACGGQVVRFQARAEDLRLLEVGRAVIIRSPEFGEINQAGRVTEIAAFGTEEKGATTFATVVALEGAQFPRLGLRAFVIAEERIAGALSIPLAAVRRQGARTFCLVRGPDGPIERDIVTGLASADEVQVLSGLEPTLEVLIDAPPAPAPAPGAAPATNPEQAMALPRAETVAEAPAAPPAEAHARGVAWLLANQNEDGSWGTFESARPSEIYLGTTASFHAFGEATTALCAMALIEPARTDEAARAALDRAVRHLLEAPPAARATADTYYDTWTHAYLLSAMARLSREERFAPLRERLLTVARRELAILEDRQAADGGFGYYDFGFARATPTGRQSTSFLTAVVLLAFHDAIEAGLAPRPEAVEDALRCVERMRLPSGAYAYGTYAELWPMVYFNRPKGSLGRAQPCNLALRRFGRDIRDEEIAQALRVMRDEHRFLAIGRARPYPHEAFYYTSGYYYLFGHYYAALAARELPPLERAEHAAWIARVLVEDQDPTGSWLDYPLYGYGKAYGTAYAVMALQACAGEGAPSAPAATATREGAVR